MSDRHAKPGEAYRPEFTETLHGDDYQLNYNENGYPELPAFLDRRPKLKLVVSNPSASQPASSTEAAWPLHSCACRTLLGQRAARRGPPSLLLGRGALLHSHWNIAADNPQVREVIFSSCVATPSLRGHGVANLAAPLCLRRPRRRLYTAAEGDFQFLSAVSIYPHVRIECRPHERERLHHGADKFWTVVA